MQHKTSFLNLALAIIVLTSWTAAAQGHGGRGHRPPPPAIDTSLDRNGDQIISSEEIADAAAVLAVLDQDGDGVLSFDECMGFSPDEDGHQGPQAGRGDGQLPAPPIFSAIDTSGDQVVDSDEIANAPSSLRELDQDGDGALQAAEYRPQHHSGGGRGGGRSSMPN